jgi:putative ABC transport system ATP-binding protein
MAEAGSIVRVTDVTKVFKLGKIDVQALKGIDLEIVKGDYISIYPSWGHPDPARVPFLI